MTINSLKVQNYKLLKDLETEKLGQINLLVGKNDSGRSTVLECLRILASGGNPSVINEIVEEHDEQIMMQTGGIFDSVSVSPKDKGKTAATVFDKNSLHNLTRSAAELR